MRRLGLVLVGATALAGCTLEPRDTRPPPPVPASWPVGDAYLRQSEAALPSVDYRTIFLDPRLQRVIEAALASNRDLRVAAANIEVARARYRIQRAELLPEVGARGGVTIADRGSSGTITGLNGGTGTGTGTSVGSGTGAGGDTGVGTGGTGTGTGGTGTGGGSTTIIGGGGGRTTTYSVSLGITAFEIDLFGRVRSLTRAALDEYFATEAAARATRLTLVGDVADAWLTYAADQSLLKIAQQTAESAQQTVRLTRARLEGGVAPRTDLRQAETILDQAQSDLAEQTTAVAQDVNALQLLVGAPVDAALLPASLDEVNAAVGELPAGLDSSVLLRRPDVVQAEYQLRSANAQIGAARAALFPTISLTASLGFASTALKNLFDGGSFNWSVAPNASYSIFDFGGRRAGVAEARANREGLLASYERTIQSAFREVADALARRGTITEQERADRAQLDAAADTLRLTDASYRGGITPFLNTLDAQRTLYAAQRTLAGTQLTRLSNLVTLYRVLGGDSQLTATAQGPQPLPPAPAPAAP